MPQSYSCLYYHLVFGTRERSPTLGDDLRPRLYEYMGGIVRNIGGVLMAAGGMPDHVHLLASLGRRATVADAMRDIKANSSRWIQATFPAMAGFAWQSGYGAFTVSHSNLDRARAYIAGQAEHHRSMTFQEEFRAFLDRHGITYDERHPLG